MGILDLLMGSNPGMLGQLLGSMGGSLGGGSSQPGAAMPSDLGSGAPGGIPTMPGSSIPYGQQGGLLGNGLLGNAARGALYGLGAAGQPGSKGFGAGIGRGAAQSIGMQQQRGQYGLQQALGQQALVQGQQQNTMGQVQIQQQLAVINYRRARAGMQPLSLQQFLQSGGQNSMPTGLAGTQAGGANVQSGAQPQQDQGQSGGQDQGIGGDATQAVYQKIAEMNGALAAGDVQSYTMLKGQLELDPAFIAMKAQQDARAKGFELSRPGAAHYGYDQNGRPRMDAQNAIQMPGYDKATGDPTSTFVFPPQRGAAAGGASTNGVDNIYDIADVQAGNPPGTSRVLSSLETSGSKDSGPGSVSPTGKGVGRMQINPDTVPQGTDLTDAFTNAKIGSARYREYSQKYTQKYGPQGGQFLGAMAYNAGPAAVDNWILRGGKLDDPKMQGPIKYGQDFMSRLAAQGGAPPQAGAQPGAQPGGGSGTYVTGMGPGTKAYTEHRNADLAEYVTNAGKQADAAKQQNFLLDRLESEGQNINMGKGADIIGNVREWALRAFPDDPKLAGEVQDYQAFRKNLIPLGSQAITQVSNRESQQGQQMIRSAFPSPETSPQAFHVIVNQFRASNDYRIGEQAFVQQWLTTHQTPEGAKYAYEKNMDPTAFWFVRMSPEEQKAALDKLGTSADGQAYKAKLRQSLAWGLQNNILEP